MPMRLSTLTDIADLEAIAPAWQELAYGGGAGALFRSPAWLLPWWRAYREVLDAKPCVLAVHDGDELVCLAPFYTRVARGGPGLKLHEIRLMGDAGPRPPAFDLLVRAGGEEASAEALVRGLDKIDGWDVVDLQPLRDPSRVRALMAQRLDATGRRVESSETGGARRIALAAAGLDAAAEPEDPQVRVYDDDDPGRRKGLAALRRLSRLEWAAREEASPIADAEATRFLREAVDQLTATTAVRVARLDDAGGEAIAAALVVDDNDRAIVVALAVDPEHVDRGAGTRLLTNEARAAAGRGCVALDVVTGAGEIDPPPLPNKRQRAIRLRAFNSSRAAAWARTYGAVRRQLHVAREAPTAAAAGARAAWSKIRTAAAQVAGYQRLHLYRGQLWTRGIAPMSGLALCWFSEADFDALPEYDRMDLLHILEVDESHARDKWRRGDLVVLARIDDQPAGVGWCARGPVMVPELGREVRPGPHECYIHDVFVAPWARGRAVAPSMLEFLARELRQQDVYRSWALIGSDNFASIRAFEKAHYTAVADVVYARMGAVDRLSLRPPDPEAKKLFGIT